MIDNWTKVTVGKYEEIRRITNSGRDVTEVNTELLSVLTDIDVEDLLDMPLMRYNNLLQCTGFLYDEIPQRMVATKYVLGGVTFDVMLNIEKMTAAQFIDYQNYIKDIDNNLVPLISIFLIPQGYKYNDGYNIIEMQNIIRNNLCIIDANALAAFFLRWYESLLKATVSYLIKKVKRLMKKETNKEAVKKMQEAITLLEKSGDGLTLLTELRKQ